MKELGIVELSKASGIMDSGILSGGYSLVVVVKSRMDFKLDIDYETNRVIVNAIGLFSKGDKLMVYGR